MLEPSHLPQPQVPVMGKDHWSPLPAPFSCPIFMCGMVCTCRAQMVQGGFMTIWERLVKKLPNVHKNVNILKADRCKDDPKKPILIT